jgi:hypothetical protein
VLTSQSPRHEDRFRSLWRREQVSSGSGHSRTGSISLGEEGEAVVPERGGQGNSRTDGSAIEPDSVVQIALRVLDEELAAWRPLPGALAEAAAPPSRSVGVER